MTIQAKILAAIAMSGLAALAMTSQANALTAQECSAKYQAAKSAGRQGIEVLPPHVRRAAGEVIHYAELSLAHERC